MRKLLTLLLFCHLLLACNNRDSTGSSQGNSLPENLETADTTSGDSQEELIGETATEKDGTASDSAAQSPKTTAAPRLEGEYRRVNSEGNTGPCDCSCIEISFDTPTQLCISPEKIYITGRFEKTDTGTADIYFVREIESEALADEIPWQEFDTNIPIATVSLQPDNSLKLDWKGFSINGEIAVDYAIYGKKTLEGNYIKP